MSDAREAKIATSHYDSSTAQITSVTVVVVVVVVVAVVVVVYINSLLQCSHACHKQHGVRQYHFIEVRTPVTAQSCFSAPTLDSRAPDPGPLDHLGPQQQECRRFRVLRSSYR